MTVPSLPSGSGAHGVLPGVEKDGAGFVFQGVISDSKALVLGCSGSNIAASKINPEPAQVRS